MYYMVLVLLSWKSVGSSYSSFLSWLTEDQKINNYKIKYQHRDKFDLINLKTTALDMVLEY